LKRGSLKKYKGNDIIKALLRKGFECKDTHHVRLILKVDGKKTLIRTRISHSHKSVKLSDYILREVARQLGFVKEDNKIDWDSFGRFINCPMDYEEYIKYLKDKGVI